MKKKDLSTWTKIKRMTYLRLVVPLKRSPHPPEYTARGVLVGVMWAMTPLVGIQMTTVLITWIIAKKIFKWDFSLPIAVAYTWLTNVFTMWPIYYVFYATGKLMMGSLSIDAFSAFTAVGKQAFSEAVSFWEIPKALMIFVGLLLKDWGLAMAIGCLPWSILSGWLSYQWTLKWLQKRAEKAKLNNQKRSYWRRLLHKDPLNG